MHQARLWGRGGKSTCCNSLEQSLELYAQAQEVLEVTEGCMHPKYAAVLIRRAEALARCRDSSGGGGTGESGHSGGDGEGRGGGEGGGGGSEAKNPGGGMGRGRGEVGGEEEAAVEGRSLLEDLPEGWTKRITDQGKSFYQHKLTRTTQWNHPLTRVERGGLNVELARR